MEGEASTWPCKYGMTRKDNQVRLPLYAILYETEDGKRYEYFYDFEVPERGLSKHVFIDRTPPGIYFFNMPQREQHRKEIQSEKRRLVEVAYRRKPEYCYESDLYLDLTENDFEEFGIETGRDPLEEGAYPSELYITWDTYLRMRGRHIRETG